MLKIAAAQRRSGSYKRVPQRRAPSRIDAELIRRLVEAQPDIVLVELQQKAAEQGVRASTVHLWRILAKLGLRLKKSHSMPPSATPKRTARSAKVHLQTIGSITPEDLIYVDESGVSTQMTRLYGPPVRDSASATGFPAATGGY